MPNILTSLRLVSPIYFIIIIFIFKNPSTQALILLYIFILLSITDYLDGFLARKLNITSNYGKVFDPISDKVLTSTALLYLCSIDNKIIIPSILIIFREFLISGVREFSLITERTHVRVSYLSKIKTTLQVFVITSLLILFSLGYDLSSSEEYTVNIEKFIYFCIYGLWIVAVLTLYTGFKYCFSVYYNKRKG